MADVITEAEALSLIEQHGHYLRIGPAIHVLRSLIRRVGPDGVVCVKISEIADEVGENWFTVQRRIRSLRSTKRPYVRVVDKVRGRSLVQGYRVVRRTLDGNADDQPQLWRHCATAGKKNMTTSQVYAPPVKIFLPFPIKLNAGVVPVVVPPADWRILRSWPACNARGWGYQQVLNWVKCAAIDLDQSPHLVPLVKEGVRLADVGIPCAILHKPDGNAALFRYAQPTPELVRQLGRLNGEIQRLREELRRNDIADPLVRIAADYGRSKQPSPRAPSCDNTDGP